MEVSKCENDFDKYVLYCRDVEKLNRQLGLLDSNEMDYKVISYDMEKKNQDKNLVPYKFLDETDEIILVLSAFVIEPIQLIDSMDSEDIEKNIRINIISQIALIQQYVNYVENTQKKLRIVFMDSGAAYKPLKGWSLYCCGKAYMDMFLECLVAERSYDVVLYDPGVVDTGMQQIIRQSSPKVFDRVDEFKRFQTEGKLHTPAQVAKNMYDRYMKDWNAQQFRERY